MKIMSRWMLLVLSIMVGGHLIFVALELLGLPADSTDFIFDSGSPDAPFEVEDYLMLYSSALKAPGDKVFLIGASNAREGFRPAEIEPFFQGAQIFNLSIGGSNISQISSITETILERMPADLQMRSTYIIGIWHGLFVDNATRWNGPPEFDLHRLKFGLYQINADGAVEPAVPVWAVAPLTKFALPIQRVSQLGKMVRGLYWSVAGNPGGEDPTRAPDWKASALRNWDKYLGGRQLLSVEQIDLLVETVSRLNSTGANVVVVELPLPDWHREQSPYYKDFISRRDELIRRIVGQGRGVKFFRICGFESQSFYRDSVHPDPQTSKLWAKAIADGVQTKNILNCE